MDEFLTALIMPFRDAGFPVVRTGYSRIKIAGVEFYLRQRTASSAIVLYNNSGFRLRATRDKHGRYNLVKVATKIVAELSRLFTEQSEIRTQEELQRACDRATEGLGALTGGRMAVVPHGDGVEVRIQMNDLMAAWAMGEHIAESWAGRIMES